MTADLLTSPITADLLSSLGEINQNVAIKSKSRQTS